MTGAWFLGQLNDAVDDQRDQDQNNQRPADEHHRSAVPLGGFGLLAESVERRLGLFGRRRRFRGGPIDVGMPGRLIVEVVRWAVGWHGTDGTERASFGAALGSRPRASASGDKLGYQQFLARFREKALAADFEGYLAQADAMA